MRSRHFAPFAVLFLAACAEAPPPPPLPPPAPVQVAEPQPAPEPQPTEPRTLLALARWRGPIRGADQILKSFGSSVSVESLVTSAVSEIHQFVDLGGSVDFAVALDPDSTDDSPKVLAAFSIPLKSFDDARAYAEKDGAITPVSGGALRLSGKKADKAGVCDLSPAADVPARLVCGPKGKDVDGLRLWLARGLPPPSNPGVNDLVISMRAAPLRDRYMSFLHNKGGALADQAREALARQTSDPELLDAPGVVLDEGLHFVEDLDGIDLRLAFGPQQQEAIASGTLRFGAKSSWITRLVTESNDKGGPPPAIFWRAPRDAYSASWGRSGDPHAFDGIRRVTHKALVEALGKLPLPDADKGALVGLVDTAPRGRGAWVLSQGLVKAASKPAAKGAPIDLKAVTTAALGWTVTGVEVPAADYIAWFKQAVDVYGRGLRLAHDFIALTSKAAPKGAKKEDPLRLAPKVSIVTSPPGYPRGTVAFDVAVTSELAELFANLGDAKKKSADDKKKPAFAKGTIVVRFAIVPDGNRTWMGFSADLEELKKRLSAVVTGAPDAGTLTAREGLERLRDGGQTWGGFFSLGDVFDRATDNLEREKPDAGKEARAALASMPNHARTPILMVGTATPGDKPSNSTELRFEAGTLADVAALVTYFVNKTGGKKVATP